MDGESDLGARRGEGHARRAAEHLVVRWALLALVSLSTSAAAQSDNRPGEAGIDLASACRGWSAAAEVGALYPEIVREASGLDFSVQFPDRVYHIADGNDSRLYVTDIRGRVQQVAAISGFDGKDVEDVSVGRCADGGWCVFVADIGDNAKRRRSVEILVLGEPAVPGRAIEPRDRVRFRYPDGSHDAEGFAVHPGGDFFVITRNFTLRPPAVFGSQIFRLSRRQWQSHGGEVQVAELVGTIDFNLLGARGFPDGAPTAMDISSDGRRVLVLTYGSAYELLRDLTETWRPLDGGAEGRDYQRIEPQILEQQEAVAFLADGDGFLYGTEFVGALPVGGAASGRARLMRVDCVDGRR